MQYIIGKSVILTKCYKFVNNFSPITIILFVIIFVYYVTYKKKRYRLEKLIDQIPGPPKLPILGNTIEINVDHDELFSRILGMRQLWGRRQGFSKAWVGSVPYVFISNPSIVEPILCSTKHIDKSYDYEFLQPWLGTGLLTSRGHKWHQRRKILTPAFHFKILDDFIDIFHEQSVILVNHLAKEVGKKSFNIFPYVTLCTLDIVCETAMGQQINAQGNSESEYVKAVYEIGKIVLSRQVKIWLQPEFIFRFTSGYKAHQRCIKVLHGYSNGMIRERQEKYKLQQENRMKCTQDQNNNNNSKSRNDNNNNDVMADEYCYGKKKRLAFLDLLIEASQNGTVLSNEDIREEVDTFMFEGHDTTSAAICWALLLIGSHPNVQERCIEEIQSIVGKDKDRSITMTDLMEMKYLECCIKEALRLYPSVPLIARQINEDIILGEYTIPAGTTACIVTYMVHRNPDIYPKPEHFIPERFLPENCYGRHPYAYIPFSAGPRNCIGQKFAILEEKAIISNILRHYIVEAVDRREDLVLLGEQILRPKDGLQFKITARD